MTTSCICINLFRRRNYIYMHFLHTSITNYMHYITLTFNTFHITCFKTNYTVSQKSIPDISTVT